MAESASTKSSKDKSAEQVVKGPREKARHSEAVGPQGRMLALQRAAGNHAVGQLLQMLSGNSHETNGKPDERTKSSAGRAIPGNQRGLLERSPETLPPIFIDQGQDARQTLAAANARAAARGGRILAQPDAFSGIEGKARLAHEVAHVLQQHERTLPLASAERAEADASAFATAVLANRPAAVQVSAPLAWAFDNRKIQEGDKVSAITISGNQARVEMTGPTGGYTLNYSVSHNLPPRKTPYTVVNGFGIKDLSLEKKVHFSFKYKKGDPQLKVEHFPAEVTLRVLKAGSPLPEGSASGKGSKSGGTGEKGTGKGKGAGVGEGGEKSGTGEKGEGEGQKVGEPKPAGDGDDSKTLEGEGGTPLPETAQPGEAKVPVITVTDKKQIEELKKKGLIPAETADRIKAKLDKQEMLTFEEAMTLVDGLNRLVEGGSEKESKETRESWLKWAKFIEENKDKISGKTKAGDKGITVEEVREILKKHKEFVGIKEAPAKKTKDAVHDPELRKSWNSLNEWEKKLWDDYLKKYGDTADVTDSSSKDLQITKGVRFSMALRMSPQYMQPGAKEAAEQLFNDPLFIGSTIAGISLYIASWLAPEPIFSKATAATITIALLALFSASEIKNLAVAWMRLSDESANAKTLPELEMAAENFGKAVGGVGLRILVMLATILAGKALPGPKPTAGGGPRAAGGAPATVPGIKPGPGGAAAITGGVTVEEAAVATIKVLADGTVVIVQGAATGAGVGTTAMAMQGGEPGGGSSGGRSTEGGTGGKQPTEPSPEPKPESAAETKPAESPAEAAPPEAASAPKTPAPKPPPSPRDIARQRGSNLVSEYKESGIGAAAGRSGGHGEPFKRAGAELIRQANGLPKNDPLREALKIEGNRLIERGKSISHKGSR